MERRNVIKCVDGQLEGEVEMKTIKEGQEKICGAGE